MQIFPFQSCLPDAPDLSESEKIQVKNDYLNHSVVSDNSRLEQYILENYQIDLSSRYGTLKISNPWGKASGQLSMTLKQVQDDQEAGLGFVVLKTVIAEDETGEQSMGDWAVKEARMKVEPIIAQSGEEGWTVSWKGRGWSRSFEDYLEFFSKSLELSFKNDMLVIPSCKYHLPAPGEENWKLSEYQYTTSKFLEVWNQYYDSNDYPMPLEKDFSPTLAGSDRAKAKESILNWLETVPEYICQSAEEFQNKINRSNQKRPNLQQRSIMLGLKVFNALFEDSYQIELLQKIHEQGKYRSDFFIYGNRLFDPDRQFEDYQGIAYGGPDLSHRNLNMMETWLKQEDPISERLPWSATGNIQSGKMAMEYALRGAESFQLHTYFQLPSAEYSIKQGNRTARALHELYFHPEQGLIAWMISLGRRLGLKRDPLMLRDLIGKLNEVSQS